LHQKKSSTQYNSNPAKRCAEHRKPCVKKELHPVQIKPRETLGRTLQTLRQKKAPPSTTQTLRNAAQNAAKPASKKTLHFKKSYA
jgi:hypothetical protein